jgi:aminopeptidase-like protein
MFHQLLAALTNEVSGHAAKNLVARISQWHRIQASPMYREAAEWLHATLQSWGLTSQLERFPAREGTLAWAEPMFQEWWCDEASLYVLEPAGTRRKLADYRAVPLSLMPRSGPADGEYELVAIDGGDQPEHYDGLDVRGKLVLTRLLPMSVHHLAIERFGAAGLIFDGMRSVPEVCPPGDLQDDIQYASWWWWGGETRAFGFALSPRVGAELRQLVERSARRGQPVRVHAHVRSHFADGTIETVSALVAGETNEEVLITGHLCHPAPFANDNASGAAAAMEAARALHTLIASGQLRRPKRGIRFLWMPEMTGTYAYLAAHEADLGRTVAGLNLDMVGEDQEQCGSSWLLVRGSDALPSFAEPLLEALREGYYGQAHTFNGQGDFPLFRHAVVPFSNGSDHYILGDPSVGIPSPMLIQWPDRYYHTTADTLEKVSPASLARSAALAATYGYFIANAGPREVSWLAREMNYRFEVRLARKLQSATTAALGGAAPEGPPWDQQVAFRLDRQASALESLGRLDPQFDPQPWRVAASVVAEAAWARSRDVLDDWRVEHAETLSDEDARLVPVRRYRGPISLRPHLRRLPNEEREAARATIRAHGAFMDLPADVALYWADGQRTLEEILDLTELETHVRDAAGLAAYFKLLARLELLELR